MEKIYAGSKDCVCPSSPTYCKNGTSGVFSNANNKFSDFQDTQWVFNNSLQF